MNNLTIGPKYIDKNDKNITKKLEENIILNKKLFLETNLIKSKINEISGDKWRLIRTIVTDYEYIGNNNIHNIKQIKKIKYISRAYFKLIEILNRTQLLKNKKKLNICCLAEAPGGFMQCLKEFTDFKKIVGISLNDNSINFNNKLVADKRISFTYGDESKKHDGNLYNPEIITHFCNHNQNIDFVSADGGFSVEDENLKGQYHNQLFLAEVYVALKVLKDGGSFVIKVYDLSNKFIIDIFIILNYLFDDVKILKPLISREMNNEKYIICKNLMKYRKHYNKIITDMFGVLKKLWENKTLIPLNLLHNCNYSLYKKIENIERIDACLLKVQQKTLNYALRVHKFYDKSEELYELLDKGRDDKYNKSINWLKKNNLLLYKNG